MKNIFNIKIIALAIIATSLSGCVLTKVVTVPARIVGAVVSVVPVIGPVADSIIDAGADVIDVIPL